MVITVVLGFSIEFYKKMNKLVLRNYKHVLNQTVLECPSIGSVVYMDDFFMRIQSGHHRRTWY